MGRVLRPGADGGSVSVQDAYESRVPLFHMIWNLRQTEPAINPQSSASPTLSKALALGLVDRNARMAAAGCTMQAQMCRCLCLRAITTCLRQASGLGRQSHWGLADIASGIRAAMWLHEPLAYGP